MCLVLVQEFAVLFINPNFISLVDILKKIRCIVMSCIYISLLLTHLNYAILQHCFLLLIYRLKRLIIPWLYIKIIYTFMVAEENINKYLVIYDVIIFLLTVGNCWDVKAILLNLDSRILQLCTKARCLYLGDGMAFSVLVVCFNIHLALISGMKFVGHQVLVLKHATDMMQWL